MVNVSLSTKEALWNLETTPWNWWLLAHTANSSIFNTKSLNFWVWDLTILNNVDLPIYILIMCVSVCVQWLIIQPSGFFNLSSYVTIEPTCNAISLSKMILYSEILCILNASCILYCIRLFGASKIQYFYILSKVKY